MSRRRRANEIELNGTAAAVAEPPPSSEAAPSPAPPVTSQSKSVAGFAAHSDRTTRLEVAVWARQVKVIEREEITQYSLSFNRAWRDKDGHWTESGFYRAHDVPVLLYLIQQAHAWCIAKRTVYRTELEEELPF
jgi:hypothetical protein